MLDEADGDTPEDLIAERAQGGPVSGGIRTPGRRAAPRPGRAAGRGRPRPLAAPASGSTTSSARSASRSSWRCSSRRRAARGEALDHVLLAGPPGLGKTSLAQIVANELGVDFVPTAGPALERKGDVASYLTALEPRSVFFVDEIHRLPARARGDVLPRDGGPQAADHRRAGRRARGSSRSTCREFTLIGATTRTGLLTTPLRDRFGVTHRLELYEPASSRGSCCRSAGILDVEIDDAGRRDDRRARARHAAGGQPAAQARARLRRGARRRARSTRASRARRSTCSRSTRPGSTASTGTSCAAICEKFGGGPVGLSTLARRRGRGVRHDRGRLRALPAPAGLPDAHAARPRGHRRRLRATSASSARRDGTQALF